MSPRSTAAEAGRRREEIAVHAAESASVIGLEGLTLGRVADQVGISKAGLVGQFGSKEELQLAALDAAIAVFRREVWEPAAGAEPGLPRLRAILGAWVDYLAGDVFPGGCFITAAGAEFDDRPGRVRDAVAKAGAQWNAVLGEQVLIAVKSGEMPASTDHDEIVQALTSFAVGLNQAVRLHGDHDAPERARRLMAKAIGAPSI